MSLTVDHSYIIYVWRKFLLRTTTVKIKDTLSLRYKKVDPVILPNER